MEGALAFLAPIECTVFAVATALVAAFALSRRGRPLTRSRAFDVGLSSILFIFLGIRGLCLAATCAIDPALVVPGASMAVAAALTGLYVAAGLLGLITHRGRVGWRVLGTFALAVVAVVEIVANATVLAVPPLAVADTFVSLAMTAIAIICTAFFWNYRTATPKPLGSDTKPFDY
ncbi:MAG: hypothetical protein AAF318_03340 [Pseudomonadota bacterium]